MLQADRFTGRDRDTHAHPVDILGTGRKAPPTRCGRKSPVFKRERAECLTGQNHSGMKEVLSGFRWVLSSNCDMHVSGKRENVSLCIATIHLYRT